jgi:hypothetical protein
VNLSYTVLAPTGGLPTFAGIALSMTGVGAPADYGGGLYVYSGSTAKPTLSITGVNVGNRIKIYQWEGAGPYTCTNLVAETGADATTVAIQVTTAATGTVVYVPVVDDGSGSDTGCPDVNAFPAIPYAYYVFVPPVSAPSGLARQSPTTATGRDDTPTITVSGVTSGNTIKLFTDNTCTTEVASGVASATTIDLTTSALTDAAYTFYANATDSSSTSSCSTANVTYTLSTTITAPSALTLTSPGSSTDADPSPVINVDGVVAGDDVNIYTNNTCTTLVGTATAATTNVDVGLTSALVTDGTYNFYAKSVNGAVSSTCSTAHVQYILSASIPAATSLTLISPTSSRGLSVSPIIRVSGVANGDTVGIFSDSSCTTQITTAYPTGTTVDVTVGLTAGDATWNFYATRVNGFYHSGCSTATVQYSVDTGGYVSVSAMSNVSTEGDGAQQLAVTLSAVKSYPVTVYFNTIGSTGVLGTHYSLATSSVTIPAGQSSANISYSILDNALTDGETYLQINLEATDVMDYITVGTNANFKHLIRDNEGSLNGTSSISVGATSVCAIVTGGVLKCWGNGYLGNGANSVSTVPIVIDSGTAYSKVSVGNGHTCAITTGGVLKCWGYNGYGQVGDGTIISKLSPVIIDVGTSYSEVSVSSAHACGVTVGGDLKCWGSINYSIDSRSSGGNVLTPTAIVVAGVSFQSVSVWSYSSCAIATNNDLYCWGGLATGYGTWGFGFINEYDPILIGSGYSKVRLSEYFLAIKTDGSLYCGGCTSNVFAVVDSGVTYSDVQSYINSGYGTFAALTTGGELKIWGWNPLAFGPMGNYSGPAAVTSVDKNVSQFSLGLQSGTAILCAIKSNVAMCASSLAHSMLGMNVNGGYGTTLDLFNAVATPTVVMNSVNSVSLESGKTTPGTANSNCAIDGSGYLYCWGKLTPDCSVTERLSPIRIDRTHTYSKIITHTQKVAALRTTGELMFMNNTAIGLVSIDSGVVYTDITATGPGTDGYLFCGLTSTSVLKCWGYASSGLTSYIGNGTTGSNYELTPVVIDSGVSYSQLATGYKYRAFSCAISTAGALKCWGNNSYNEINSSGSYGIYSPYEIDAGAQYSKVSLAANYGCAITTVGALKCWGTTTVFGAPYTTPTVVDSGVNYSDIVLSHKYGCGITSINELKCWGARPHDGGGIISIPIVVDSGVGYVKVAISKMWGSGGESTACGITTGGVLKCWGAGLYGQIGNGSVSSQATPVVVDSGVTYLDVQITSDATQVCGITSAHQLKCWGINYFSNSLGNGQTPNRLWNRPIGLEP